MANPSRASATAPDGVGEESPAWVRGAADDLLLLDRSSTAERVADILRKRITEGHLHPGTRLSEEALVSSMHISRNTLREAFRLLTHERLLVHRLHRGVFVPRLGEDDVVDLYRLRRTIECEVVQRLDPLRPALLDDLRADVHAAEAAAARDAWRDVGTANMRFHQHLVALAGSRRIDEVTERLLAELRLLFHVIDSPEELHRPYIARNRQLLELLESGDVATAAGELRCYLDDSEAALLRAFREQSGHG